MFVEAMWFDFYLMQALTHWYLTLMVVEISTSFHYSLLVADEALRYHFTNGSEVIYAFCVWDVLML